MVGVSHNIAGQMESLGKCIHVLDLTLNWKVEITLSMFFSLIFCAL